MYAATATQPEVPSPIRGQGSAAEARKPRLLDRLREALRSRQYSPRTEQTYRHRVERFIFFRNVRHPVPRICSKTATTSDGADCFVSYADPYKTLR